MTDPAIGNALLLSISSYHTRGIWYCRLLLLMPDHLHALLAFEHSLRMSESIRTFKRATARFQQIAWQDGYFDHRIRDLDELEKTEFYIRHNPVAKNLCPNAGNWPWLWAAGESTLAW